MRRSRFLALILLVGGAVGCGLGPVGPPKPPAAPVSSPDASADDSASTAPQEKVESPVYRSWSTFPPGTKVVHRSLTGTAGNPAMTTTTTTYTLIERTDDRVVIEMQAFTRRYDGVETNNPPERLTTLKLLTLPPGVSKADVGKPSSVAEQREEVVQVDGKEYKSKWYKGKSQNEAGEVLVQTWTSDEVPGGLVKSITQTPAIGKTTTLELIEVKTP